MNLLSLTDDIKYIMKFPIWLSLSTFFVYVGILGACVFWIINIIWRIQNPDYQEGLRYRNDRKISAIFGFIERAILFFGLVMNFYILLSIWVAFRFASTWRGWQKRRTEFNIQLTGIGLNLIFAVLSKLLLIWLNQYNFIYVNNYIQFQILIISLLMSFILWFHIFAIRLTTTKEENRYIACLRKYQKD
jgi:hypothetical protein